MPSHRDRYVEFENSGDYLIGRSKSRLDSKEQKPCRACMDFTSWAKFQKDGVQNKVQNVHARNDCPLDKDELGRKTWSYLHTMAAYYPDNATPEVQRNMKQFFERFTQFYPCQICANDFSKIITERPPETSSQATLSQWLCWAHNSVNRKLGKPEFDCSLVDQRWLTGWKDGSCD